MIVKVELAEFKILCFGIWFAGLSSISNLFSEVKCNVHSALFLLDVLNKPLLANA